MTARFADRVVVVTGGAQGLGVSHVRGFAEEEARVVIADLAEGPGSALADELGDHARFVHLDVTDEQSWARLVADTEAVWGPVDVLVNNAGLGFFEHVLKQRPDDFRKVMEVNVTGVFLGMQAVLPSMVRRGRGAVVNISSMSGLIGAPGGAAYGASKWAVRGLTKTSAVDLAGTGVRINSVHPGTAATAMTASIPSEVYDRQAIPRLAAPREITEVILFVASDQASFCTGAEFIVDGGATTGRTFDFLATAQQIVAAS